MLLGVARVLGAFRGLASSGRYTAHTFEMEDPLADKSWALRNDRAVFQTVARPVPASSIGRAWNVVVLGQNMVRGAVSEGFKGGFSGSFSSWMTSDRNVEQLAESLLKMRGAALKLGQFLSFLEHSDVPQNLVRAMEKARRQAYKMPDLQLEAMMRQSLGSDWRAKFDYFQDNPFAAASIGQVHQASMNGQEVAVKIQYPGVAESIDSDMNNIKLILEWTNAIPKGMYAEVAINHMKGDLVNECNYNLEAGNQRRYRDMLSSYSQYYVPEVLFHTKNVIISEYVKGLYIEEIVKIAPQAVLDEIGRKILELTIQEIFEFRFMQSDPNPANFIYDFEKNRLVLIDFGSCNEYSEKFVEMYRQVVIAGVKQDRQAVLDISKKMGFITGEENQLMIDAHVQSVYAVGEPLASKGVYDFSKQTITKKVDENAGAMITYRQKPPPPEIYSLHRKLSGAFLLCMKLKSRVPSNYLFKKHIDID